MGNQDVAHAGAHTSCAQRYPSLELSNTVAVDMTIINADHRRLVPIGGIAHAGAHGIPKVELQVDGGPWKEAALRTPLSHLTWVICRYEWPFDPGKHAFTVRCYDGNGVLQIATLSPVEPSGATGLYKSLSLRICERRRLPSLDVTTESRVALVRDHRSLNLLQ